MSHHFEKEQSPLKSVEVLVDGNSTLTLTAIMYAIVKNVVRPALISIENFEPLRSSFFCSSVFCSSVNAMII